MNKDKNKDRLYRRQIVAIGSVRISEYGSHCGLQKRNCDVWLTAPGCVGLYCMFREHKSDYRNRPLRSLFDFHFLLQDDRDAIVFSYRGSSNLTQLHLKL